MTTLARASRDPIRAATAKSAQRAQCAQSGLSRAATDDILRVLFAHRRLSARSMSRASDCDCEAEPCETCFATQRAKVAALVIDAKPLHFVLPAFPAKSPSPTKVLGTLPDRAEEIALRYLQDICNELGAIYAPGASITICSDGRVFADLVGVSDANVTRYADALETLIARIGALSLSTFRMEDAQALPSSLVNEKTFRSSLMNEETFRSSLMNEEPFRSSLMNEEPFRSSLMNEEPFRSSLVNEEPFRSSLMNGEPFRSSLFARYAEPLTLIRERVRRSVEERELFDGIHRFLFEDRIVLEPHKTRSQVRRECKALAYAVIQRSNAWSRLVAARFPEALRLSIHPQPPHSEKIGIRLAQAQSQKSDIWLTPWHGVAVERAGHFSFMRRREAEALGARLVHVEGRPSHFEITP